MTAGDVYSRAFHRAVRDSPGSRWAGAHRRALDADDLEALQAETVSPGDELAKLERLRQDVASRLWMHYVDTRVDDDALRLLLGAHNMLYLSHPQSDGATTRSRSRQRVFDSTITALGLPGDAIVPPLDEAQLVARHTLLAGLCDLSRVDIEVRFWVGRRQYFGQRPPQRLTYWRGLRNVREIPTTVRWLATPLCDHQRDLLQRLFSLSPLTDLLNVTRAGPRPKWTTLCGYLQSARVARLVAHHYLQLGDPAGAALARDFWQLVDEKNDQRLPSRASAAIMMAQLVQYLYASRCISSEPDARVDLRSPESSPLVLLLCAQRVGLLAPMETMGAWACAKPLRRVASKSRPGRFVRHFGFSARSAAASLAPKWRRAARFARR
jgi:hypothetical protein